MTDPKNIENRLNFTAKVSAWAKADPLFTTRSFTGAEAVFSGSSTTTFNALVLDPSCKRGAFKIIDQARSELFDGNPFAVWSWQDGQLQNLPVQADAVEEMRVMTATVADLKQRAANQEVLETTLVQHSAHLMDVGSVIADVFGEDPEGIMVQSIYAAQEDASILDLKIEYRLAYENGIAAATGSFILRDGIAGIYDISVRPNLQKQGLGSKMFDAILARAIGQGATSFTLQASTDSANIYERAGFKTVGYCWCLDID
ncbi:MAG: GNAT family N-acetyltransferase [Kordiimonadaceae bacterium]|nr:GNAT family N-acetyltransferase [Kordiimonadaceae bacterium]